MKTKGNLFMLFYRICWIGKAFSIREKLKQELNEVLDAAEMGE